MYLNYNYFNKLNEYTLLTVPWPNQFNLIQGRGAQTVQIVQQATTTQNQIKLVWP